MFVFESFTNIYKMEEFTWKHGFLERGEGDGTFAQRSWMLAGLVLGMELIPFPPLQASEARTLNILLSCGMSEPETISDYLGQPICLMDMDTESQRGEMPFPESHTAWRWIS